MCGIFAVLSNDINDNIDFEKKNFHKGKNRGPENSIFKKIDTNAVFGFHRLAINGYTDPNSEQPIELDDCILICNGEIYNWREIHHTLGVPPTTQSDCEIIIHLYKQFGIEYTVNKLDGVFSFMLFDKTKNKTFIARDPFGVRPLFYSYNKVSTNQYYHVFSSELKMMTHMLSDCNAHQFKPGSYAEINMDNGDITNTIYYNNVSTNLILDDDNLEESYCRLIKNGLIAAVKKRVLNTDREVACLLSGGLDSSLITALVAKSLSSPNKLKTWSIGMEGSEDLKYARLVANHIGTDHHEMVVSKEDFLGAIPEVIYTIESHDTTTVRASVGNWLISKFIKEFSDSKVIFNGDGSDEITGGYMYFHCAPNSLAFDHECKRLLNDLCYFDVLRSDRSISSHGLEARTPFLDKNFVQMYLSIPADIRFDTMKGTKIEKYLLRKAFDNDNLLPKEVLWRRKEAFSDGVSASKESWFETIQNFAKDKYKDMDGPTAEKYWYKELFNQYYPNCKEVIPYMWMPKFIDAVDASARTLDIYKSTSCEISSEKS
uniref:asparagine synthase (glutamine-hydrolyzing) n=1 Tax=viral metagenome TaxID=1070528 RepID=A0A6C0C5G8_9ZZZZ